MSAPETLPALLERRRGIRQRTTRLAVAAILVVAGLVYLLVIYDPLDGNTQVVHRSAPVFNVLYAPGIIRPVAPGPGELLRLRAHRRDLDLAVTVRPLRLPAYRGDVAGVLPVFTDGRARQLARSLPNFEVLTDGRTRVHTAPGYQVGFRYGSARRPGVGVDILAVPPETPGARDGVLLSFRKVGGRGRPGDRVAAKAMRSAFASFEFGPDHF